MYPLYPVAGIRGAALVATMIVPMLLGVLPPALLLVLAWRQTRRFPVIGTAVVAMRDPSD